jgi:hypothetical protein
MSDLDVSDFDQSVLDALRAAFPVSQSPYCDIASQVGCLEIDVLNSAMKLREIGVLGPISAQFTRPIVESDQGAEDSAVLAELLGFDVPWGEHPYAEIAAQLSLRGIDRDEAWVIEQVASWLRDGTISRLAAEPA